MRSASLVPRLLAVKLRMGQVGTLQAYSSTVGTLQAYSSTVGTLQAYSCLSVCFPTGDVSCLQTVLNSKYALISKMHFLVSFPGFMVGVENHLFTWQNY